MFSFLALGAVLLIDHTPTHWHMSCTRWQERSQEILMDENLPMITRMNIVRYLRSKVKGDCPHIYKAEM